MLVDGHPVHQSDVDAVRAEFRLGGSSDTEARAEKEAVRRELVRLEAERLGVEIAAAGRSKRAGPQWSSSSAAKRRWRPR